MRSFIFINNHQALRFGHVAWGFALTKNLYCWGSSDHLLRRPMTDLIALAKYSHVPAAGDIDFWSEQGSYEAMLASMAAGHHIQHHHDRQEIRYHINYHVVKELHHQGGDYDGERALAEVELVKAGGWSLLTNNCIDQTYRIIDAFGAGSALVDPKLRYRARTVSRLNTMIPKKWFAAAEGKSQPLDSHVLDTHVLDSHVLDSHTSDGRQVVR